jgi:hypothetical protein
MTGYLELTKGEASFALRGPFAITRAICKNIYQHLIVSPSFLPAIFDRKSQIANCSSRDRMDLPAGRVDEKVLSWLRAIRENCVQCQHQQAAGKRRGQ